MAKRLPFWSIQESLSIQESSAKVLLISVISCFSWWEEQIHERTQPVQMDAQGTSGYSEKKRIGWKSRKFGESFVGFGDIMLLLMRGANSWKNTDRLNGSLGYFRLFWKKNRLEINKVRRKFCWFRWYRASRDKRSKFMKEHSLFIWILRLLPVMLKKEEWVGNQESLAKVLLISVISCFCWWEEQIHERTQPV